MAGLTQVTDTPDVEESYPVWSPDDSRVAFFRYLGGSVLLFTANADGTGETEVASLSSPLGLHWRP